MRKPFHLLGLLLLMFAVPAGALLVYECNDPADADLLVYERDYSMNSDLHIEIVENRNWADEEWKWYFTDTAEEADVVIYITTDKEKADLLIWYVEMSHQAGWEGYHPYKGHLKELEKLREVRENE